jgi:hypothetical protein
MKTIKLFVFTILSVLLLSKVTLAQSQYVGFFNTELISITEDDNFYEEVWGWNFYDLSIETKKTSYFYISNTGKNLLTISEIDISEGFKLVNNETTITISPMGTYKLFIEFAPTKAGKNDGTITFTNNIPNVPSPFSIPLTGFWLPIGTPRFCIERASFNKSFNFGEVIVGKTGQCSVPISNTGTGTLVISSVDIKPDERFEGDERYELTYPQYKEDCKAFSLPNGETTITIEPGNTYNLIVEFTPTKIVGRLYWGCLSFTHNGVIGDYGLFSLPNMVHLAGTAIEDINNQPVSSTDELEELPTAYSLSQNYPNPFNPTTKIEYSLPEAANVRLAVYNSLGQEVASLINEYQSIGKHIIDFNANNLPSGIYFYKIQSGNFNKTQKMVLMK